MLRTFAARRPSHDLRQIRTHQVAAFMQAVCIALRAVSVEHLAPFRHVAIAAVFLDQLADEVEALSVALGAFDAEHFELAFDVAEDQIRSGHRAMLSIPAGRRPNLVGSGT
jgi:hypothetical protein